MNTPVNNESKIIDKIIADANAKKDEILAQANDEVNVKIEDAKVKAQKETNAAMEIAKVEAEKAKAKEISGADMQAKKKILAKKQELIEQTIQKAKEKLLSLNEAENEKTVLSMLSKVGVNSTTEVVLSSKATESLKTAIKKAGYKISTETRDISGGFILKDGDIEYNYSFESMIIVEREQLEQTAAKILFS